MSSQVCDATFRLLEMDWRKLLVWVAAARPKALPMANGQTIGKLAFADATHPMGRHGVHPESMDRLWRMCRETGLILALA
jgi:hypothetical protein